MSKTSLSPRYKTINPPSCPPESISNIYKARCYAGYETGFHVVEDDNLKSFPAETALSVWHGSAGISRWRRARNLSLEHDARFPTTKICSHKNLLPILGCPSPLLSQPGHVYVGVTRQRGVGTVGQALSEIPSYGWRTGRRWDFRYHARAALIIDKLLR